MYPRNVLGVTSSHITSAVSVRASGSRSSRYLSVPRHFYQTRPSKHSKYTAFTLARYHAFRDHRIIGVDPRGYGESTHHTENWSHEENAEDMKLSLDEILPISELGSNNNNDNIGSNDGDAASSVKEDNSNKIMVLGYSTGAGAAARLALNYPERISANLMVSALPLNGMRTSLLSTKTSKPTGDGLTSKDEAIHYADTIMTPRCLLLYTSTSMLSLSTAALSQSRSLTNWSGRKRLKTPSQHRKRKAGHNTKSGFQSNLDSSHSLINTKQKTKLPKAKIHPGGATYIPPALLLPTSSRFAYVARAAFDDDSENTDPRGLARQIFADVAAELPFSGASFEYFAPKSFQHELPTSINQKGSMTPEVCFLGRSNVGGFLLLSCCLCATSDVGFSVTTICLAFARHSFLTLQTTNMNTAYR